MQHVVLFINKEKYIGDDLKNKLKVLAGPYYVLDAEQDGGECGESLNLKLDDGKWTENISYSVCDLTIRDYVVPAIIEETIDKFQKCELLIEYYDGIMKNFYNAKMLDAIKETMTALKELALEEKNILFEQIQKLAHQERSHFPEEIYGVYRDLYRTELFMKEENAIAFINDFCKNHNAVIKKINLSTVNHTNKGE